MLNVIDLAVVLLITLCCSAAVTLLAHLFLRLRRQASIATQITLVVVTAVAAIACSTVVISAQMYLSEHDLHVLFAVLAVSVAVSLLAARLTGQSLRASVSAIRESALRIGDGDVVGAGAHSSREFGELSAQLADMSERLAGARQKIADMDASRREFFAWISHDLRTPLTGVRALAEALEAGVPGDRDQYIRQIRAQADVMSRMVDDLFALSQLDSGALRLAYENVDLLDAVSDAVSDVGHLARARGIRVDHAGVDRHTLRADPHGLARVLANLLTNSIKHAPAKSQILVTAHNPAPGALTLSVLDQGPGVPEADLERIFDVGWRGGSARTPVADQGGTSGAGLGLAIVRGIAVAHGGGARARNIDGGFRVDVEFPQL